MDDSDFYAQSSVAAEARRVTWDFGLSEFVKYPFLGHGYGGWAEQFGALGIYRPDLGLTEFSAPQNTFNISLWSQSGLVSPVLIAANNKNDKNCALRPFRVEFLRHLGLGSPLFSLAAFILFYGQGMAENFGMFGSLHTQGALAVLLAWLGAHRPRAFTWIYSEGMKGRHQLRLAYSAAVVQTF